MARGQFFSIDMLIAIVISFFLLFSTTLLSERVFSRILATEQAIQLSMAAETAAAQLISSQGNPGDWNRITFNEATVSSLGLAESRSMLDWQKVDRLFELSGADVAIAQKILGLTGPGYNFTITVYRNGTTFRSFNYTAPSTNASAIADRIGVLNGTLARVRVTLWRS